MQPAVFIARLVGPLLVVIGVGVLLNEANYAAMITEATHSPTLIYLCGLLTYSPVSPLSMCIGPGPPTGASSSPSLVGSWRSAASSASCCRSSPRRWRPHCIQVPRG